VFGAPLRRLTDARTTRRDHAAERALVTRGDLERKARALGEPSKEDALRQPSKRCLDARDRAKRLGIAACATLAVAHRVPALGAAFGTQADDRGFAIVAQDLAHPTHQRPGLGTATVQREHHALRLCDRRPGEQRVRLGPQIDPPATARRTKAVLGIADDLSGQVRTRRERGLDRFALRTERVERNRRAGPHE